MLLKPPTKRLSFSAPDSGEGNDFQIGGPTHRCSQTAGVRWAGVWGRCGGSQVAEHVTVVPLQHSMCVLAAPNMSI